MATDNQKKHNLPVWVVAEAEKNLTLNNVQGLGEVARSEANLGRPKPTDTKLTNAEKEITQLGNNYLEQLKNRLVNYFSEFEDKVDKYITTNFDVDKIDRKTKDFVSDYKNEKQTILIEWSNVKQRISDKYKEIQNKFSQQDQIVNTYRQTYNIGEEANSASLFDWVKLSIYTAVLFSIEIWINRSAIGGVSVGGLNYGLLISIIIASINVYGSSLVGYTVTKHINDHDKSQRSFYKIISSLYVLFLIYLNWIYAAYRQVSEDNLGKFIDDAITQQQMNEMLLTATLPWNVPLSVPSVGLLGLGLLFGGFAMYKFYHINDTRPGYGRISSKRNRLKAQLDEMQEEKNKEIASLRQKYIDNQKKHRDSANQSIENAKTESLSKLDAYNTIINDCQVAKTDYEDYRTSCLNGVKHMIDEFRIINKNIQSASNNWHEPEIWKEDFVYDDPEGVSEKVLKNHLILDKTDGEKRDFILEHQKKINAAYDAARDNLVSILEEFNKEEELILE